MLRIGNGVANDILKEDLEYTSSLFVNKTGDTLDTSTTCQASDSGFGDTLNVVTQDLPVALSTALAEAFATFSATRHVSGVVYGLTG